MVFFEKLFHWGKKKKKWIVICVWKIRIFLLRGFFHLFFYKIHFKEIKTESNWKKREYFIFSFFEGYFFFIFFIYKLLILWRCFLLVLFLGVRYFFSFIIFSIFLAVFFIWRYFSIFLVFFSGFWIFFGTFFCITFFCIFLCNFLGLFSEWISVFFLHYKFCWCQCIKEA